MNRRLSLSLLSVVLALAIGASAASAAKPKPPGLAAYRACLKAHGVSFGGSGPRPTAAKTKAAFAACASKAPNGLRPGGPGNGLRPNGPRSAAFRKYAACLKKHGITFTRGVRPDRNSAAFKAASKACASLRPKRPAAGTNG